MATKNAVKSGNWSDTTVWNGGTLPAAGDDVYANNFTVTIDQNINVGTLRTTSGSGITAGGGFTCAGNFTITVTGGILGSNNGVNSTYILTITAGSAQVNADIILSTTSRWGIGVNGGTPTITGTITGGTGASSFGIVVNGSASVTYVGNATGSSGSGACLYLNSATATLTATGNVTGGSAANSYGAQANAAGTLIINGNVTGGSNTAAYGLQVSVAASVTISGVVKAGAAAPAVNNASTNAVRLSGTVDFTAGGLSPLGAGAFVFTSAATVTASNDANFPSASPMGTTLTLSVAGSSNPATADVRYGTTYGPGGALTGTLKVPPASSVAAGVPVDAATGTAALKLADVLAGTGSQIAAVFP